MQARVASEEVARILMGLSLSWEDGDKAEWFTVIYTYSPNDDGTCTVTFTDQFVEYMNGERTKPYVIDYRPVEPIPVAIEDMICDMMGLPRFDEWSDYHVD